MSEVATRRKPELISQLERVMPELGRLGIDPQRFARIVTTELRQNELLRQCTPQSFLGAVFEAAQLGLEPGRQTGHFWIVPKRIQGTWEAVPILGYKGMVELALRPPHRIQIRTGTVRQGDDFDFELGSHAWLRHRPDKQAHGQPYLWYAVATHPDGRVWPEVLNRQEVEARRHAGSSPGSFAWEKHWDRMAMKSCIRSMCGSGQVPMSPQLERAIGVDERVLRLDSAGREVEVVSVSRDQEGGEAAPREVPAGGGGRQDAQPDEAGDGPPPSDTPSDFDRAALRLRTAARHADRDGHDLVELIRDRHGTDADDFDTAVASLDAGQIDRLADELEGGSADGP